MSVIYSELFAPALISIFLENN